MTYKTNINALHDVISGKIRGRRTGKTTAICHEIAGNIELTYEENNTYSVLVPYSKDSFVDILIKVLSEHEIDLVTRNKDNSLEFVYRGYIITIFVVNSNGLTRGSKNNIIFYDLY